MYLSLKQDYAGSIPARRTKFGVIPPVEVDSTFNRNVVGSNPTRPTKFFVALSSNGKDL